jgi:hypothetical protein
LSFIQELNVNTDANATKRVEIFNVFMSLINHFLIVGAKIHKRIEFQVIIYLF